MTLMQSITCKIFGHKKRKIPGPKLTIWNGCCLRCNKQLIPDTYIFNNRKYEFNLVPSKSLVNTRTIKMLNATDVEIYDSADGSRRVYHWQDGYWVMTANWTPK